MRRVSDGCWKLGKRDLQKLPDGWEVMVIDRWFYEVKRYIKGKDTIPWNRKRYILLIYRRPAKRSCENESGLVSQPRDRTAEKEQRQQSDMPLG